jgi:hypothetical protein
VAIRGILLIVLALVDVVIGFVALRSARRRFGVVSTRRFVVAWAFVMAISLAIAAFG